MKTPRGIFRFVALCLGSIPKKTSFHPWKFWKIVWHPSKIPRSIKNQDFIEIRHNFFLEHPRKFHFLFNWYLEFPHAFSSTSLYIPCPEPHPVFFSGEVEYVPGYISYIACWLHWSWNLMVRFSIKPIKLKVQTCLIRQGLQNGEYQTFSLFL